MVNFWQVEDKNPRLKPIGVGEVFQRMTGKVVVSPLREEVISSVRLLHVCAGHGTSCEAAVHVILSMFEEENTEAVS